MRKVGAVKTSMARVEINLSFMGLPSRGELYVLLGTRITDSVHYGRLALS
jgi:hypothetical protein